MLKNTVFGHQGGEYTLAQSAICNPQSLAGPRLQQCLQDGATGKNEVCAILADAGLCHPFRVSRLQERRGHGARLRRLQPAAIHLPAVVTGQPQVHPGQRRHSARGAQQVRIPGRHALAQAVLGLERHQHGQDIGDHGLESFPIDEPSAVALRKRHDAHRQRRPCHDAILHLQAVDILCLRLALVSFEIEPDQLRRASADIEYECKVRACVNERGAAGHGQPGLGLATDHLDIEIGFLPDAAEKMRRVFSQPAGLCGDQARTYNPMMPYLGRADFESIDGTIDRALRQAMAGRDALAQANDARERVNHLEAPRRGPGNKQATIVGAEVQRCVGAVGIACLLRAIDDRTNGVVERMAIHGWRRNAPFAHRFMVRWRNLLLAERRGHGWRRTCAALIVPLHRPSPAPDVPGLSAPRRLSRLAWSHCSRRHPGVKTRCG